NADQLTAGIAPRSQGRGDEGPVQSWLRNAYSRILVGNFEPARRIFSLEHAACALGSDTLPAWVAGHFKAAAKALS
ncbi:hypothetical protein C3L29_041845, partial [Pseudomonas sp. MWU12-2534b]